MSVRIKPIRLQLAEGEAPEEIQVLRTGNFNHPFYGPFSITTEFLEQMISNFELNVRGVDLMIDYNHDCEEAAAWITGLSLKNNGSELWASVDWTEIGLQDVLSKKYRYVSADFDEKYMDPETNHNYGPTLLGAALTNRPFVKNMAPAVELTETQIQGETMKTIEQLQAENKTLTEEIGSLKGQVKTLSEEKKDFDGLKAQAQELRDENKALKEEIAQLKSDKELSEKKEAFNKLLAEGKAVKAQEEAFLKGDTAKFAELAGSVNSEAKGSGENPSTNTETDPEEQVIKLAEEMVKAGKAKDIAEAQSIVLSENPELRKKLYA